MVEHGDLDIGDAQPVNSGADGGVVWTARVQLPDGRTGAIVYEFDDCNPEDPSDLPWDAEHASHIELDERWHPYAKKHVMEYTIRTDDGMMTTEAADFDDAVRQFDPKAKDALSWLASINEIDGAWGWVECDDTGERLGGHTPEALGYWCARNC
jgi:hypothetical protein